MEAPAPARYLATSNGNSTATVFVYDVLGQLVAQYSSGSEVTPDCQTCYLSYDHLGSTRLVTDEIMGLVARHDYLPFGEEVRATRFWDLSLAASNLAMTSGRRRWIT